MSLPKSQRWKEQVVHLFLLAAASTSVLVTAGIFWVLLTGALGFFKEVSVWTFLTDTVWTPLFDNPRYGVLPLLAGTFTTAGVALVLAIPLGTLIAIYLSEFASHRIRETLKPVLELLGSIPTVVYGYFALVFVTPLLQKIDPSLAGFNMLSAGLVMGIAIIPYISSLTEDAMRAVPMNLREASYAMGATRLQNALRTVFPAALSGVLSAYVLGISRAIGETMIVAVAAGMQANFTFDPSQPGQTVSAYIVQVSMGDLPYGSLAYKSIFAVGLTLIAVTLFFNLLGHFARRRFRETY